MAPGVDQPLLAYLHGRAPDAEDKPAEKLVLSKIEFDEAYAWDLKGGRVGNARLFLLQTITSAHVVFLGCSLSEPCLQDTLEMLRDIRKHQRTGTEWVMVVGLPPIPPEGDPDCERLTRMREAQVERVAELGIGVVVYTTVDDKHEQLSRILKRLRDLVSPASQRQLAATVAANSGADEYGT
jgi:hypothetical protein